MKFFSELGLCFGGATIAPTAETTATSPQQLTGNNCRTTAATATGTASRGRLKSGNSTAHWKPALTVISEDGVVSDVYMKKDRAVRSEKRQPPKAKPTAKVRSPSNGDEYWRSSHPMALPAFSPTPFLF